MRQYENYWMILKKNKKLTLQLPKQLVPRLIRMVSKEKDMDMVFKMETENKKFRIVSYYEPEKARLRLILKAVCFSKSYSI